MPYSLCMAESVELHEFCLFSINELKILRGHLSIPLVMHHSSAYTVPLSVIYKIAYVLFFC